MRLIVLLCLFLLTACGGEENKEAEELALAGGAQQSGGFSGVQRSLYKSKNCMASASAVAEPARLLLVLTCYEYNRYNLVLDCKDKYFCAATISNGGKAEAALSSDFMQLLVNFTDKDGRLWLTEGFTCYDQCPGK